MAADAWLLGGLWISIDMEVSRCVLNSDRAGLTLLRQKQDVGH